MEQNAASRFEAQVEALSFTVILEILVVSTEATVRVCFRCSSIKFSIFEDRINNCFLKYHSRVKRGLQLVGGLEKLSQGRNFFFLIPAPAQLSAYANHEFKIIPTPTQLSAYANHGLEK